MRIALILLALANLALFGYTRLDHSSGESVRLTEQVQPDKIRLLSAQEVAALGPSKVASLADVCLEWGPFSDADRSRALGELAPLGLGALVGTRRVDAAGRSAQSAIVLRDPPQAAVTRVKELQPGYPGTELKVGTCEKTP